VVEKYSIREIDKFLRDRGMSLEGNEAARRSRAKSRRMRESPTYKKTQEKYRASGRGKQTLKTYVSGPHKEVQRRYHQRNKPSYAARSAAYKAAKLRATSPVMSLSEKLAIDSMYKGAKALSLPKRVINVDHFVPLKGRFSPTKGSPVTATGLHNIHNLRWMYEGANKAKKDLIPKQSLLQTETPTRNIFESVGRAMEQLYPPPVGSRSGVGAGADGGRWRRNPKTGRIEWIKM
jgi:hypothetical protein|tara:strand:- start:42 stop:743 length:702 start_codon:yes stop_codon:yes gene_type:complete